MRERAQGSGPAGAPGKSGGTLLSYHRYYAAGFVSMAEATQTPTGVVEAYEKLAREVLERPESIPSAIHNLLLKLAETHPGAVYWIIRKFYQEYLRLYVSDTGYIGIADRYEPDLMYPGDIAIYMVPESPQEGDVVQITFTAKDEVSVYVIHGRVLRCNEDRSIQIEDTSTGEDYRVVEWNILGKLVKVIPFGSDEWQELFQASSVPKEWVAASVEGNITSLQKSDISGKDEVISELRGRLAKLV
ncbi:hypothetical protein MBBA_1115 [Methanoculleus bourgensis]|jgi:hypothetical protein|uniref:Uncharacterized protein n=2 Tax=Methanoculleus bourgensis TaxID=83986 RepID=A0A0X3BLI0_9EURY|nr:conserved protein of unknown function [Methanoculleus bourgensis]SAI87978.1 hypothetical protein MBBA_1115 [Methanoculleus bourgensis]